MSKKKQANSANKYLSILAAGFIFCSLFILLLAFERVDNLQEGSADFSSLSLSKENALINSHLQKTTEDVEFNKLEVQLENMRAMKAFRDSKLEKPSYKEESNFFDFDGDPRLRQLAEDVGRANDAKSIKSNDPQSIVYQNMINDKRKQQMDYEQKRLQAKQFIERARKDGWAVVIDENFKIKSYQRIDRSEESEEEKLEAKRYQGYELFPSK